MLKENSVNNKIEKERIPFLILDMCFIDKDEFNETMINLEKIKEEALNFVEDYIAHKNGSKLLHIREYERRYKFSPLQYFHKELGIEE